MRANPVGLLLPSPSDVSWGSDTPVQPDLFVVEIGQAGTTEWAQMQQQLLAIEILSQSSRRADRFTKRGLYQRVGIPDYWVVDIDAGAIERWTPDATAAARYGAVAAGGGRDGAERGHSTSVRADLIGEDRARAVLPGPPAPGTGVALAP